MLVTLASPALATALGLVLAATAPTGLSIGLGVVASNAPLWAPPAGSNSGTGAPAQRARGNSPEALEAQVFGEEEREPTPQVRKAPARARTEDQERGSDDAE